MDDFSKAIKNGDAIPYEEALELGKLKREARERQLGHGCDIASCDPMFVDDWIQQNIHKAQFGDRNSGLRLLQEFIETTDHEQVINAYIAEAFQKILNGADPLEALNIKAYNRPAVDNEKRDLRINRIVQRSIDGGKTLTESLAYAEDLAGRFARFKRQKPIKLTTIKEAYYRFNENSLFNKFAKETEERRKLPDKSQ